VGKNLQDPKENGPMGGKDHLTCVGIDYSGGKQMKAPNPRRATALKWALRRVKGQDRRMKSNTGPCINPEAEEHRHVVFWSV